MTNIEGTASVLIAELETIAKGQPDQRARASEYAATIREAGSYRWVGIYEVAAGAISLLGFAGDTAPAYPSFPITSGLSSVAVAERRTVISNDVANDPRYLTAFDSTGSEMIVPAQAASAVVGTIDVESERINAFNDSDRTVMERCASLIARDTILYPAPV